MAGTKKHRVVSWGPGAVGLGALQGIIDHPELELVGVRVYSPDKDGKDAGELCGRPPVGVAATRDVEHLLSLKADCVCFTASDAFGLDVVVDEMCRILESGTNIANGSAIILAFPALMPDHVARIEEACRVGSSSFYFGGVNPGFATDVLPSMLATGVRRIERIEIHEHLDCSTYQDAVLLTRCGFGCSPKDWGQKEIEEIATYLWAPSANDTAHAVSDARFDMRISYEVALADEPFEISGDGTSGAHSGLKIAEGSITAVHCNLGLFVGETLRVDWHEYIRVAADGDGPWPEGWPAPPGGNRGLGAGGYRSKIHGENTTCVDMWFDTARDTHLPAGSSLDGALIFTGMRLVNFIPLVCEAAPGYFTPTGLLPTALTPNMVCGVDW